MSCSSPRDAQAADSWSDDTVSRQLHTSGVLDALRVARTGYPDRMPFLEFASTFADVAGFGKGTDMPDKEKCAAVLQKLEIPAAKYQLGKTRVFLSLGVLDELKTKRTARMAKVCLKIQAMARGMRARKQAAKLRAVIEEALAALAAALKTEVGRSCLCQYSHPTPHPPPQPPRCAHAYHALLFSLPQTA